MLFILIFILFCMGLECCKLERIPWCTRLPQIGRRLGHFGDIFGWRDSFGFCFWKRFSISTHVWKDFESAMGMGCYKNGRTATRVGKAHYWKRKESCTEIVHAKPHPIFPYSFLDFDLILRIFSTTIVYIYIYIYIYN